MTSCPSNHSRDRKRWSDFPITDETKQKLILNNTVKTYLHDLFHFISIGPQLSLFTKTNQFISSDEEKTRKTSMLLCHIEAVRHTGQNNSVTLMDSLK